MLNFQCFILATNLHKQLRNFQLYQVVHYIFGFLSQVFSHIAVAFLYITVFFLFFAFDFLFLSLALQYTLAFAFAPSRQILVSRTSRGRPPPTFPGLSLKILFDRPGGRPEMTSRGRLNLTFKGRPWEVDSRCSQDVLRTSHRGP